jgi:hypothetical protein
MLVARTPAVADGTLTAQFTAPATQADVGMLFRLQDAHDYYFFTTANGGAIGVVRGGTARLLPGFNAHRLAPLGSPGAPVPDNFFTLAPATAYTVMIVLAGPQITVLINGPGQEPYMLGANDATFGSGGVGLRSRGSAVRFGAVSIGAAPQLPASAVQRASDLPAYCSLRPYPGPDYPAPLGDYGDAPDGIAAGYGSAVVGRFPTRFDHHGAYTRRMDQEWLGPLASLEYGPTDPYDADGSPNLLYTMAHASDRTGQVLVTPDCDARDDGKPSLDLYGGTGFSTTVSVERHAPNAPRYLNVVADMNLDGRWLPPQEWVVRNCTFVMPYKQMRGTVPPASAQTLSARVQCPVVHSPTLRVTTTPGRVGGIQILAPLPKLWFRVLLTRFPVTLHALCPPLPVGAACLRRPWLGWDGSGPLVGFPFGEVEDYHGVVPTPTPTSTPTKTPYRPILTITSTPTLPYRVPFTPTFTPTPTTPSCCTFTPTPTATSTTGTTITWGGSHSLNPQTGQAQFGLEVPATAFDWDGKIFDLEWQGIPWDRASAGPLPDGWSWQQISGGWRAVTTSKPLHAGQMLYFTLTLPQGVPAPGQAHISTSDSNGNLLPAVFMSTFSMSIVSTPTPGPGLTGISANDTYTPQNGQVQFCIQISTPALDGMVYDFEWLGSPWTSAVPGSLPSGWSWQQVPGGWHAVTSGSPIRLGAASCFGLQLPPGTTVPDLVDIDASNQQNMAMGTFVSATQGSSQGPTATATVSTVGFQLSPNPATVTAQFGLAGATGSCSNTRQSYTDALVLSVSGTTLTISQPSIQALTSGPIDATGAFQTSNGTETYAGHLQHDGSGTAVNRYTVGGCSLSYNVAL